METGRAYREYGISTAGKAVLWSATDIFSLYFLTDVAHLPAGLAGGLFFIFLSWNALCDPVVGWLWDRHFTWRRPPRRYFSVGMVLTSTLFVLTFVAPLSGAVQIAMVLSFGLAFRTAFAAIDVPHNALLAKLSEAGCCPVRLSAIRYGAATLASIITVYIVGLALKADAATEPFHMFLMSVLLAAIGGFLFLRFFPVVPAPAEPQMVTGNTSRDSMSAGSVQFAALAGVAGVLFGATLMTVITGIFFKNAPYIAKYLFHDTGWAVDALTVFLVGKLLCLGLLLSDGCRKREKLLLFVFLASTLVAGMAMLLPPGRLIFLTVLLVLGVTLGGINMLSWALLPALAEELRTAGFDNSVTRLFGLFTALTKIGIAASGLVLGWVLELSDLTRQPEGGAWIYAVCGILTVVASALAGLGFAYHHPHRRAAA